MTALNDDLMDAVTGGEEEVEDVVVETPPASAEPVVAPVEPTAPAAPSVPVPVAAPAAAAVPATPAASPQVVVGTEPKVAPPSAEVPPFNVELTAQPVQPQTAPAAPRTREDYQNEAVEYLSTNTYKLSDAEAAAYQENPADTLPKIMAKLHVSLVDTVLANIGQVLPHAVQHIVKNQGSRQTFTSQFYGKWPALRSHHPTVERVLQAHRSLNPGDTLEELIDRVGLQASVMLRLPLPAAVMAPVTPAAVPAAQPAFTPASPGASGRTPAPKNVWETLMEDVEE